MKIQKKNRRKPIIPINSMSDIAFLLLIFIMLISLINYRREIKIEYSEANSLELTQADKNLEIWISQSGIHHYKGEPVSLSDIEALIADEVSESPGIRIHIIADRNTNYRYVNDVMEILKLLQHRVVSLVVKDESQ